MCNLYLYISIIEAGFRPELRGSRHNRVKFHLTIRNILILRISEGRVPPHPQALSTGQTLVTWVSVLTVP